MGHVQSIMLALVPTSLSAASEMLLWAMWIFGSRNMGSSTGQTAQRNCRSSKRCLKLSSHMTTAILAQHRKCLLVPASCSQAVLKLCQPHGHSVYRHKDNQIS